MTAISEMSKAIREQIESYAPTLQELPDDVLIALASIVMAYGLDLRAEAERRGLEKR